MAGLRKIGFNRLSHQEETFLPEKAVDEYIAGHSPRLIHKPYDFILFLPVAILAVILAVWSCEPLVTRFENETDAQIYVSPRLTQVPDTFTRLKVMTWNIRFGIGRRPWFGDACGDVTVYSSDDVLYTMNKVVMKINEIQPDILLLQEVDISSKRSGYVNEVEYILANTYFNYAAAGYQWKAQFIPSDGLGRLEEMNLILSRWPIDSAIRIQLPLRGDQDKLTRYFYERCCIVQAKIKLPGTPGGILALNIHASAFATDDTKYRHIQIFKGMLDSLHRLNRWFVAGGDLNTLPPRSDSTDYCLEDMCPGESYHHPGDNPFHKEGSNYAPESNWLTSFYNDYSSAVSLADYQASQGKYFTHTTRPEYFWDRTLDYIFSDQPWEPGSGTVHQEAREESDHAPLSAVQPFPIK